MFQIVIDTNTPPATPSIYADIEKTIPAPSVIPLVQGFREKVRVYFVGDYVPSNTAGLALYIRPMRVKERAVETVVAAQQVDENGNVFYDIDLQADTSALSVALGARENVVMRAGFVAYDAIANPPTQIEWQVDLAVSATSVGYGQTPPISPSAIEAHNLDENAHPFILQKIAELEEEAGQGVEALRSEVSELATDVSEVQGEVGKIGVLESEVSELGSEIADLESELSEVTVKANKNAQAISENQTSEDIRFNSFQSTVAQGFVKLESEVSELVSDVSEVSANIQGVQTDVSELNERIAGDFESVRSEIADLESGLTGAQSEIGVLETDVSELSVDVVNHYAHFGSEISEVRCDIAGDFESVRSEISEDLSGLSADVNIRIEQAENGVRADVSENFVDLTSNQAIEGIKTFAKPLNLVSSVDNVAFFRAALNNPTIVAGGGGATGTVQFPRCNGLLALTKQIPDVSNFVQLNGTNNFTATNNFNVGLNALPLGTQTVLGAPAYGLSVSANGGLQLFGTHFLKGSLWGDNGLKIVENEVSMTSTDSAAIGFDYANEVTFRTMPNDGNEATFKLEAWEWTDDSHTVKAPSAGVKLLKPSQATALEDESVLNKAEVEALIPDTSDFVTTNNYQVITGDKYFRGQVIATNTTAITCLRLMKRIISSYDGRVYSFPCKSGILALTDDIPDTYNFVTVDTTQTITGSKAFTGSNSFDNAHIAHLSVSGHGVSIGRIYVATTYGELCLRLPSRAGCLALIDDIPTDVAVQSGCNVFSQPNRFDDILISRRELYANDLKACSANVGNLCLNSGFIGYYDCNESHILNLINIPSTELNRSNYWMSDNNFGGEVVISNLSIACNTIHSCDFANKHTFPAKSGTVAHISDIEALAQDYVDLASTQTITGSKTFATPVFESLNTNPVAVSIKANVPFNPLICSSGGGAIGLVQIPRCNGILALTKQIPAICKTTLSTYETLSPTAGTLYFLSNS